jgi:hypothetical protein
MASNVGYGSSVYRPVERSGFGTTCSRGKQIWNEVLLQSGCLATVLGIFWAVASIRS